MKDKGLRLNKRLLIIRLQQAILHSQSICTFLSIGFLIIISKLTILSPLSYSFLLFFPAFAWCSTTLTIDAAATEEEDQTTEGGHNDDQNKTCKRLREKFIDHYWVACWECWITIFDTISTHRVPKITIVRFDPFLFHFE